MVRDYLRFVTNLKVCYKDTDSLLYRIETKDLSTEMVSFKHLLDLSDYPETQFLHDKSNKKVPLTMTDELQGKVLTEIVCLRTVQYSIPRRRQAERQGRSKECEKDSPPRFVQVLLVR